MNNVYGMKALSLIFLLFYYSWASFVIKWPQEEVPTLTLNKTILITQILSFCIRFQWRGTLVDEKRKNIICGTNRKLCLNLKLSLNHGFVTLNENDLIFEVPKNLASPHAWHNFCFSSDEYSYQVVK